MSLSTTIQHIGTSGTTAVLAIPSRLVLKKISSSTTDKGVTTVHYRVIGGGLTPVDVYVTDSRTKGSYRQTYKFIWPVVQVESLTGATIKSSLETQFHVRVPLEIGLTGTNVRDVIAQTFAQMAFGSLVSNALSASIYEDVMHGSIENLT